jgi:hypothetical protein
MTRRSRRRRKSSVIPAIPLIVAVITYANYGNALAIWMGIGVAIIMWMAFVMPTYCDVQNKTDGEGCGNPVRGKLRACRLHKRQKHDALWAMFRLRNPAQRYRVMWARASSRHPNVTPSPADATPRVLNPLYDGAMLVATVIGSIATVFALMVQVV